MGCSYHIELSDLCDVFFLRMNCHEISSSLDLPEIIDQSQIFLATIIDRFWLVTSKKCCLNKDTFKIIFDDENRSKWLFGQKEKQVRCTRKRFCSKMHPRNDEEF